MVIDLIGVPMFYGSDKKGSELAPNKLREKNLVNIIEGSEHQVYDLGNIYVPLYSENEKYNSNPKMKYLDPIVSVDKNLSHSVYSSLTSNSFPFVIGGDHSIGLGSICGASKFYKNLAVIWVDAHGDLNTDKTSNTGNVHGMPLAAAIGIGPSELTNIYFEGKKVDVKNVFIIGARDLDSGEIDLISKRNLNVYTSKCIKDIGINSIMKDIFIKLKENNIEAAHLSFDIDCIDSSIVPGTGTPVKNGVTVEDVKYLLKFLMETKLVKSMDLVELNPLLDRGDETTNLVLDLISWTFKYLN